MTIDVETLNEIMRLLELEIKKYPPGSEAAVALYKFQAMLSNS
jgi:hypothetical protein